MHQPQRRNVPAAGTKLQAHVDKLARFNPHALLVCRDDHFTQVTVLHKLKHSQPRWLLHSHAHNARDVRVVKVKHALGFPHKFSTIRGCCCGSLQRLDRAHRRCRLPAHRLRCQPHLTKLARPNRLDGLNVCTVNLLGKEPWRRLLPLAICFKWVRFCNVLLRVRVCGLLDVVRDGFGEHVALPCRDVKDVAHHSVLLILLNKRKLVHVTLPRRRLQRKRHVLDEHLLQRFARHPVHHPHHLRRNHNRDRQLFHNRLERFCVPQLGVLGRSFRSQRLLQRLARVRVLDHAPLHNPFVRLGRRAIRRRHRLAKHLLVTAVNRVIRFDVGLQVELAVCTRSRYRGSPSNPTTRRRNRLAKHDAFCRPGCPHIALDQLPEGWVRLCIAVQLVPTFGIFSDLSLDEFSRRQLEDKDICTSRSARLSDDVIACQTHLQCRFYLPTRCLANEPWRILQHLGRLRRGQCSVVHVSI